MIVSTALSLLGLGFLVTILFSLAVYALPFFVAMSVGIYVYDTDAGVLASLVSAFLSGAATLVFGQIAFATIKSFPVRLAVGALYALPAGIAGFHTIKGLSEIGGAGGAWTLVFGWIGAFVVGGTAWARIASLAGPDETDSGKPAPSGGGRAANNG